jgi:hypothetical protein
MVVDNLTEHNCRSWWSTIYLSTTVDRGGQQSHWAQLSIVVGWALWSTVVLSEIVIHHDLQLCSVRLSTTTIYNCAQWDCRPPRSTVVLSEIAEHYDLQLSWWDCRPPRSTVVLSELSTLTIYSCVQWWSTISLSTTVDRGGRQSHWA